MTEARGAGDARLVAARYQLLDRIGAGANAFVYSAFDQATGDLVAVKLLMPTFSDDPEFVLRFRREAQAAASLRDHPNVVRILDWGSDGDVFLAMEHVAGGDLRARIARGRLAIGESVRIAMGVAAALEAAHARGIVHRDVKPQNILLDEQGEPKLADFGIARALWLTQLTRTNLIFGSPHYLSPEQARGLRVDGRADVYALGVVLYELLAGRPPFVGESAIEIALKHLSDPPRSPRVWRPEVRPSLEAVVLRALAKDPRDRYQSAAAMRAALAAELPRSRPVVVTKTPRVARPARVALALPALLLIALLVGGAALATPLVRALAPQSAQQPLAPAAAGTLAPATQLPSSTPLVASPTVEPAPPASRAPESSQPPAVAVAPQAASRVVNFGPIDAIARFYQLISAHDLDGALALWDAHMRGSYPPATYLYHRFAATSFIGLNTATVVSQTDTSAKIAVDISEIDAGVRHHWVGYWYLVRGPNGWQLDQPALAGA